MKRRAFLSAVGASLAACVAPSAIPSPTATSAPAASPAQTRAPTAAPTATPRAPDWAALRSALRGTLRIANDAGYDDARLLYNTRFDAIRPLAVASCADERDVQACVRFARSSDVPLRVRSGGHSYAGWSSGPGLVVDLRPMSSVTVAGESATIGPGAHLIDVYDALSARGRGIAAGSCPTVGVSGLTLGGGVGVLSRAWGLTCDQLTAARVVLADGTAVTCDASNEPDLFWALRGGGGSFGAVTSLTFATHPASDLALAFLVFGWADAPNVVSGWQRWMRDAPETLWATMHLSGGTATRDVTVHAVYPASAGAMSAEVNRFVALAGRTPAHRESGVRTYRDVMLLEGGCLNRPVSACHLAGTTPDGVLRRETYAATSVVARDPLADGAIDVLVAAVDRATAGGATVLFDALGGAVSRVAPDATAFPHRRAFAMLQLVASWDAGGNAEPSLAWLADITGVARKNIGVDAYANYAEPDLVNWPAAYYGANYPRLQRVKRRYDPDRLFDFPQAIVPA